MRGKGSACANAWKSDGPLGGAAGTKRGCQGTVRGEDGDRWGSAPKICCISDRRWGQVVVKVSTPSLSDSTQWTFISRPHKGCFGVEAVLGVSPPSGDSGIWILCDATIFRRRDRRCHQTLTRSAQRRTSRSQPCGRARHLALPGCWLAGSCPWQLDTRAGSTVLVCWSSLPRPCVSLEGFGLYPVDNVKAGRWCDQTYVLKSSLWQREGEGRGKSVTCTHTLHLLDGGVGTVAVGLHRERQFSGSRPYWPDLATKGMWEMRRKLELGFLDWGLVLLLRTRGRADLEWREEVGYLASLRFCEAPAEDVFPCVVSNGGVFSF